LAIRCDGEPLAQRLVVVDHRPQRRFKVLPPDAARQAHRDGLVEAVELVAELAQPTHDRYGAELAARVVVRFGLR
jgi:hypothetical protein